MTTPCRTLIQRSFRIDSSGLNRRIATGAGFQFLGIGLRTILTIGSTAVLARLLTPADFGYVAMAAVVTEFAALFSAFGFTNVLIQRKVINRLYLDTVFWATFGLGVVMATVVFLLSLGSPWLFADPRVAPLLQVLCIGFIIISPSAVPTVVLARQLRFRTEFWINIGSVLLRTCAGIGFALAGWGVWSLVWGGLVGHLATVVLGYINVPYWPRWRFHLPLLTSTWRTSGSYLGNTLMYYISTNLDLLLIGRQLGASPLGLYQNARTLTDEIRARIAMPIQQVLFPALSALQSDRARARQLVLRAGRLMAAVVVPIGVGVSANAPELVQVLYGAQWLSMAPVLGMMGLSAAVRASTAIASPLFNANNQVGLSMRFNLVGTVLMVGGILLAMPQGIEAVAMAVFLSSLYWLVVLRAAFGLLDMGTRQVIEVLGPPMLASAGLWLVTAAIRKTAWSTSDGVLLMGHVALGALVYLGTLHLLSRQYLKDLRQVAALMPRRN